MIEPLDGLPDWAFTEEELYSLAVGVVLPERQDKTPKHICWYHLMKDGQETRIAMLLVVESITDGQDAINKICAPLGLNVTIGEFGEESVLNGLKAEAMCWALENFRYKGKAEFPGSDKVFYHQSWMDQLL